MSSGANDAVGRDDSGDEGVRGDVESAMSCVDVFGRDEFAVDANDFVFGAFFDGDIVAGF